MTTQNISPFAVTSGGTVHETLRTRRGEVRVDGLKWTSSLPDNLARPLTRLCGPYTAAASRLVTVDEFSYDMERHRSPLRARMARESSGR